MAYYVLPNFSNSQRSHEKCIKAFWELGKDSSFVVHCTDKSTFDLRCTKTAPEKRELNTRRGSEEISKMSNVNAKSVSRVLMVAIIVGSSAHLVDVNKVP